MPTHVEDLAAHHRLISNLFTWPRSAEEWAAYRLSDEQVAAYHDKGYVGGVRVLNDAQVEVLRSELARLLDPAHPGHDLFYEFHSNELTDPDKVLFHALGHWRIEPGFHDLLWNPAIVMPASQLLGGAVRFWHDQLFCKPARHGGTIPWHQDYSYWTRTQPQAHLTCWIALDDSTIANGCVHYVPGSHRWRLLPTPEGRVAAPMEQIKTVLTEQELAAFDPVPVEVKKGEGIFHHGLVLHGSYANETDIPRRAAVVNFFRDGTLSASDEPLLAGVPPIPAGQPMGGRFFPLVFDPARV